MDWRIKGAIQKVLGYLPGGARLHYMLQRRGGALRDLGRECDIKVDDWRLMVGHLRNAGVGLSGTRLLEMGTGWYPTFPFCLYLGGAAYVHTVDVKRHLRADLTLACAEHLARHTATIAEYSGRAETEIEAARAALVHALRRDASLEDASGGVISYRAPGDAAATGLPPGSVDVVFSNSVLEHVPGPVIAACLAEARRILRPRGLVFHSVNCGDHYAYVDRSIDQLHYLRYSDREWQRWNNAFLYQNRLRAEDFTRMARDAGFTIELDLSRVTPERLAQLDATPVHAQFARYTREQLAITCIDFIGRKP